MIEIMMKNIIKNGDKIKKTVMCGLVTLEIYTMYKVIVNQKQRIEDLETRVEGIEDMLF